MPDAPLHNTEASTLPCFEETENLNLSFVRCEDDSWRETLEGRSLKCETTFLTRYGRFYDVTEPEVVERRVWLLESYGKPYVRVPPLAPETVTFYVGPLTNQAEIAAAWVYANDIENPQPVPREPIA